MKSSLLSAFLLLLLSATSNAGVITSLSGDKDCFGLGGSCTDGDHYVDDLGGSYFTDNSTAGDPAGTDIWDSNYDPTFVHTVSLAGQTVAAAVLEMFVAGPDLNTGISLSLNGTLLGSYLEPQGLENRAMTVLFSVPIAALLDGANTLSVVASSSADGYIIDYTELRITTRGGEVPAPAGLGLLLIGMAALGFRRSTQQTRS